MKDNRNDDFSYDTKALMFILGIMLAFIIIALIQS